MILNKHLSEVNEIEGLNKLINKLYYLADNVKAVFQSQHNQLYITKINQISKSIHACKNVEKAYDTFVNVIRENFSNLQGCLYIYDQSKQQYLVHTTWGKNCINSEKNLSFPILVDRKNVAKLELRFQKLKSLSFLTEIIEHFTIALNNLQEKETYRLDAFCDPLTGLYNRRYLENSLQSEICRSKRQKENIALLMLDIDYFKKINDNYGHQAGDEVLRKISTILRKKVRGSDLSYRLGGEEFLIVLPGISKNDCLKRAEEILEDVRNAEVNYEGNRIKTTVSLGISVFNYQEADIYASLNKADVALYQAKRNGRNQIVCL